MFTLNVPYGTMDTETGKHMHVVAMDDALNSLRERFVSLFEENRRLAETNKKLEEEIWKDEEMARMRQELKEMRADYLRGFPMSEKDTAKAQDWIREHNKLHKPMRGAIDASYTYEFTPTSIGTFCQIRCEKCKDVFPINNFSEF